LEFIWDLPAIKPLADPLHYIGGAQHRTVLDGARRRFSGG